MDYVKCFDWFTRKWPELLLFVRGNTVTGQTFIIVIKGFLDEIFIQVDEQEWTQENYLIFKDYLSISRISCPVESAWHSRLVVKKSLYGYRDVYCFRYLISGSAYSIDPEKSTRYTAPPFLYKLYHHDFQPAVKYATERKIKLADWVQIKFYNKSYNWPYDSWCSCRRICRS